MGLNRGILDRICIPHGWKKSFKDHVLFDLGDGQAWEHAYLVILFLEVLGLSLSQATKIIS